MQNTSWILLQLFADGGAAGEAGTSNTGETGAAAGHNQQEPGVPGETMTTRAKGPQQAVGQDAAAQEGSSRRMTWEEIKSDPEYSAQLQNMVRARLKNAKQAEADLAALNPALQRLAKSCGLDGENLDYGALAQALTARQDTALAKQLRQEQTMQQHYTSLLQQAQHLQQKYPGFQLQQELKNPAFVRLTAPNVGISVEDAYYTVHRREIEAAAMQVAAQKAAQQISNAIRSGSARPVENGTSGSAPSVTAFDYRNASRSQREALKTRIRQAGARGEKIYPGSI